jgi:hypothetical protein
VKVAFVILNMPGGAWHWVIRLWDQGPAKPFSVIAATAPCATAEVAWTEATRRLATLEEYERARTTAAPAVAS